MPLQLWYKFARQTAQNHVILVSQNAVVYNCCTAVRNASISMMGSHFVMLMADISYSIQKERTAVPGQWAVCQRMSSVTQITGCNQSDNDAEIFPTTASDGSLQIHRVSMLRIASAMAMNMKGCKPIYRPDRLQHFARTMCSQATGSSVAAATPQGPDRSYPKEPRVGVGVVVFRRPTAAGHAPDLLLVRRAKAPSKGLWCFPGGSLELGETMAQCAFREVKEETGIIVQHEGTAGDYEGLSAELQVPTPFAAVDSIVHDSQDSIQYHYAIVEVAALVSTEHAHQQPQPSDDASDAMWLSVTQLRGLQDLVPMCARITEEALQRFQIVSRPLP